MNRETFNRPASGYSILDSVNDSLRFTTRKCLSVYRGNLCANSTFVDPHGAPARWHEFGELEGVGWAANAVGGAHQILWFARVMKEQRLHTIGESILHHALEGGFFQEDGRVLPYRDVARDSHYLNYMHSPDYDSWFCPGSLAHICLQLLWSSDEVQAPLQTRLRKTAVRTADWLWKTKTVLDNGWYPRRCKPDGTPHPLNVWGDPDRQYHNSGDGVYLIWLWVELTRRGYRDCRKEAERAINAFRDNNGAFGSINHDTYDDHENVSYSVAFRCLSRAAALLRDSSIFEWALSNCLHGLERFEMKDDRNGVTTQGLLYMEDSWDTAYLWENAEAALAYLEAAHATRLRSYELKGLTILRTAALHHYGPHGFLTEGVDWNNHNGQWRKVDGKLFPIHVNGVEYGAVNYTQPFLNNMHITAPTLYYVETLARKNQTETGTELYDCEDNRLAVLPDTFTL